MKRIIALIIVFAMVLPMCLVSADDSSWESDQYGDTTDEMANNQSSTTSSLTEDEMEESVRIYEAIVKTGNDVFDTIELTVELLEDTVEKIHFIVGTILGMLDKECPLCTEVHEITSAEGDESVENEIPEDIQELLK